MGSSFSNLNEAEKRCLYSLDSEAVDQLLIEEGFDDDGSEIPEGACISMPSLEPPLGR